MNTEQVDLQNTPQIKRLFGHCFEISEIQPDQSVPVGGTNILKKETDIAVTVDSASFTDFLDVTQLQASEYNLDELQRWLDDQGFRIEAQLFAKLVAFTIQIDKNYPNRSDEIEGRTEQYEKAEGKATLSQLFDAKAVACAEIAILAKLFLQQVGTPSRFVSGDVLWNKASEFSEEHSFIVIDENGKSYIYDPTNPVKTDFGYFPSIYMINETHRKELTANHKQFVAVRNMLSKKEAYFGVNDGTNVDAERDILAELTD